jgi:hypothetical protein
MLWPLCDKYLHMYNTTETNCCVVATPRKGRVARWIIFKPKSKLWVNFGWYWNGQWWYIVWIYGPFGIFYGHVVGFTAIWYILWSFGKFLVRLVHFSRFGMLCKEKSGNPAHISKVNSENENATNTKRTCSRLASEVRRGRFGRRVIRSSSGDTLESVRRWHASSSEKQQKLSCLLNQKYFCCLWNALAFIVFVKKKKKSVIRVLSECYPMTSGWRADNTS